MYVPGLRRMRTFRCRELHFEIKQSEPRISGEISNRLEVSVTGLLDPHGSEDIWTILFSLLFVLFRSCDCMAVSTSSRGCFAGLGMPQFDRMPFWLPCMTLRTTSTTNTRDQPLPLAGSLPISIDASAPRFVEPSGSAVDSTLESSLNNIFYNIV